MRENHTEGLQRFIGKSNQTSITVDSGPTSLFFRTKTIQLHSWVDLAVGGLLPFSIADNTIYRRHVRYDPITRVSLAKYMNLMTLPIEQKISERLSSKIALVFDMWSSRDTHFIACVAAYGDSTESGFSSALLGFSPIEDEISLRAQHQYENLESVLKLNGKDFTSVVALIGNTCLYNNALENLIGCPLMGCASHRLSLCVKDILRSFLMILRKYKC